MSIASLLTHGMLGGEGGAPLPGPLDNASVHGNILDAIGQLLEGIDLQKAHGGRLKIFRRFSFTPDWARDRELPCVAYGPAGILGPAGTGPMGRTRKDTLFPVTIRVLAACDREEPDQQILYLAWIQRIRDTIERVHIGDYGNWAQLQPGPMVEVEAAAWNVLSLVLVYQVHAREGTTVVIGAPFLTDDAGSILTDDSGQPLTMG